MRRAGDHMSAPTVPGKKPPMKEGSAVSAPSRLLPRDLVRVGAAGLRTRPLRVFLSALGIAIGIAAMVCVVGVASSSRESVNQQLAALGTNLLRVTPGQTLGGEQSHLPADSVAMIGRIPPVTSVTATANPEHPNEVRVSRPSDALAAKQAIDTTLTALLLGLGALALLVGGVGVANTMVISVLERRSEIGLRRSLGATRGHIRIQFLTESLLLSALGGLGGALLGIAVTTG